MGQDPPGFQAFEEIMQDSAARNELETTWLERAQPAELKEFVEHDVLAARGQLEAALAHHPNAVNLWEAYVWTFVVTSDTPLVIEAAHLHRGENPQALSALQRCAQLNPTALVADALGRCLHRLGRIDEAIGVLEQAVRN